MENIVNMKATRKPDRKFGWLKVLLVGIGLFFLSLFVMVLTNNPNLFPTVVMVGNFLVPVVYVAFFYEHRYLSQLSLPTTALTFFYGGLLGVLASSILEPIFIRQMDPLSVLMIGLIEEGAKILGVLLIARRVRHDSEVDGIILGAAAGMGFAALESMGYAFSAFMASQGSLSATVGTTLIRGILSPVGHGTWTAILAGVLFRESKGKHFRFNLKVLGTYLLVAVLHSAWDGLPPFIAYVFSGGLDVLIAQTIIGGTGLLILILRWREARRLQDAAREQEEAQAQLQEQERLRMQVVDMAAAEAEASVEAETSADSAAKLDAAAETDAATESSLPAESNAHF